MYEIDKELYVRALQLFSGKLAGECANVSHVILDCSRDILDKDVTIAIGWVEINGKPYFMTDSSDEAKHFNDKDRFNYHVWLEGDNYFIDLTLIATLKDMNSFDDSSIPEDIVCVGVQERDRLGIIYHANRKGGSVLEELHKEI